MFLRPVIVAYKIPKWIPDTAIAPIITSSIIGLSKKATEAFFVLKPDVPQADIAWVAASNQHIPDSFKSSVVTTVRPT